MNYVLSGIIRVCMCLAQILERDNHADLPFLPGQFTWLQNLR